MNYSVIIPAAGHSTRFKRDKLLEKINNVHVIKHTLAPFIEDNDCEQIILVSNEKNYKIFKNFFHLNKKILLIKGGINRFESVKNGFKYVKQNIEYVLIHDGARPFLTHELINDIKNELTNGYDAVIPILRISDSLIKVRNQIIKYVNRNDYIRVQTPQGFRKNVLINSYNKIKNEIIDFNDEFSFVVNTMPIKYKFVIGNESNLKITFEKDIH